jgi:uncharacterized sulfatase
MGNGSVVSAPVQTIDIFPTLASLCGLTPPADLAGHDLTPLMRDPNALWLHPAISVSGSAELLHRAIRVSRWRYIEWSGQDGGKALIDELNDPNEQTNVVDFPEHAATLKKLQAMLNAFP